MLPVPLPAAHCELGGNKALSLQFTGDLIPHLTDKRAALTPDAVYAE